MTQVEERKKGNLLLLPYAGEAGISPTAVKIIELRILN